MRVGLTQRVEDIPGRDERRDCLDQRWCELLERLGMVPVALPNRLRDVAAYLLAMRLDAVILTGGNDLAVIPDGTSAAPERDALELQLLEASIEKHMPVLGVCRGMQMIQHACGGELVPVTGHAGTRHQLRWGEPFAGAPRDVNSFHNFGVPAAGLAPGLDALAWATDGSVEAFRHVGRPWLGIMWHPERDAMPDTATLDWLSMHLGRTNS